MNGAFLFHQAFAFLAFFGEDMPLEGFLESDLAGAGDFESLFGTRIGFNLWHLVMRFKMIPCWRICTGRSLGGPFGQSGHPAAGMVCHKNGAQSYDYFLEITEQYIDIYTGISSR
jgi:hypothetical protein